MADFEKKLMECCNYIDSSKVTERKKRVDELKELIQKESVIKLLNKNCELGSTRLVWDTVFLSTHRSLLKEADRVLEDENRGKQSTAALNARNHCALLLKTVANKANSGSPRLKSKDLVTCILEVLENGRYKQQFSNTYMSILLQNVLPFRQYCCELTFEHWTDLLKAVELSYFDAKSQTPDKDCITALSTLNLIFLHGSQQSHLGLQLKEKFKFLEEAIRHSPNGSSTLIVHLAQLIQTFCDKLGKECRFAICKFSENILPTLIKWYDLRSDDTFNKKALLLEVLRRLLAAHHPGGVSSGSPCALANCWDSWKQQMTSLYSLTQNVIAGATRHRFLKSATLDPQFFYFAADLAKQVFDESGNDFTVDITALSDDSFNSSMHPKRRKVSFGFSAIVDNVNCVRDVADSWPWLSLLSSILIRHPELVNNSQYCFLLSFIAEKFRLCTIPLITKYLCKCSIGLLKVEEILLKTHVPENCTELWMSIWDTTLRTIGLNQCEEGAHQLIQALLRSGRKLELNLPITLVPMFTSFTIEYSSYSLLTLRCLCGVVQLPMEREPLILWVINGAYEKEPEFIKQCAEVLFALAVSSKYPETIKESPAIEFSEIEQFYIKMSFDTPEPQEHFTNKDANSFSEDKLGVQILLKKLGEKNEKVISSNNVKLLLVHCSLLVHLTSLLVSHNISSKESFIEMVMPLLERVGPNVRGSDPDKSIMGNLCQLAEAARASPPKLRHTIVPVLVPLFSKLFSLLQPPAPVASKTDPFSDDEDDNNMAGPSFKGVLFSPQRFQWDLTPLKMPAVMIGETSDVKTNTLSDTRKASFGRSVLGNFGVKSKITSDTETEACSVLVSIALSCNNSEQRSGLFLRLLQFCSSSVDISSEKGFIICSTVLSGILQEKTHTLDVIREMLPLFRDLCKKWYHYHCETSKILLLLREFASLVYNCESTECMDHFLTLITAFNKFVYSGKYGPSTISDFVRLIGKIVEVDQSCKMSIKLPDGESVSFVVFLLHFLESPFHEVRMTAIDFIPYIFSIGTSSERRLAIQNAAFHKINGIMESVFLVNDDLSEEQVRDESTNRTICVLRILCCIISSSPSWRAKAIFTIFNLVFAKNISKSLVQRVFIHICKEMKLKNEFILLKQYLNHISWFWYHNYHQFENFPYSLLGCDTETTFFSLFRKSLVPILLENNDMPNFRILCEKIKETENSVVKDCFPEIIACLLPRLGQQETLVEAQNMYAVVQQILGGGVLKELLSKTLDMVLISIFSKLHDIEELTKLCGVIPNLQLPEKNPGYISMANISLTLSYLQKTSERTGVPLLVYLCLEFPSHISQVLHHMYLNLYEAVTYEMRLLGFLQYISFCNCLCLDVALLGKMKGYMIQHVIHDLLHLTSTELQLPALRYLHRSLTLCLPSCADVVNDLVGYIVPAVIIVAKNSTVEGSAALSVVELLMSKGSKLLPGLQKLDPLPDDDQFAPFRSIMPRQSSLRSHIVHFLNAGSLSPNNPSPRLDALTALDKELREKRSELEKLYSELEELRGFSEDCATSILHQLISALVNLTTSQDSQISEMAARCLGELGPRDLTTLVLKPDLVDGVLSLTSTIYSSLSPLLVNENPHLSLASAKTLKALFHTKEGIELSESLNDMEKSYLMPMLSGRKNRPPLELSFDEEALDSKLEAWQADEPFISHHEWLYSFVSSILSTFVSPTFQNLLPACHLYSPVSEAVLPYLVKIILYSGSSCIPKLVEKLRNFFRSHFEARQQSDCGSKNNESIYLNRASVKCMLSVVNFIRQSNTQRIPITDILNLNYLHVAQAAQFCAAYFTSILYAELWADSNVSEEEDISAMGSSLSQLDFISDHLPDEGVTLQNVLWEAYKEIGEPDAVYGCGHAHLSSPAGRIKYYEHMRQWDKVIQECELIQVKSNNKDLINSLRNFGLYSLASNLEAAEFESAWRLSNWALDPPNSEDFSSGLYCALKATQAGDFVIAKDAVNSARRVVIASLNNASLEVANSVYQPLQRLQSLREVECMWGDANKVIRGWGNLGKMRWVDLEPLLSQRGVLLANLSPSSSAAAWLQCSSHARHQNAHLIANRCIRNIDKLQVSTEIQNKVCLEEAQLAWQSDDKLRARYLLRGLLGKLDGDMSSVSCYSTALLTYGTWLAETKSENPHNIMQKFFEKASRVAAAQIDQRLAASDCLARYADNEYQRLKAYVSSAEYNTKLQHMETSKRNYNELVSETSDKKMSQDHRKALKLYEEQARIDEQEISSTRKELSAYLQLAVREHLVSLVYGEGDMKMYRLVSLWMDNSDHKGVIEELEEQLLKVASYKFLSVLPQLVVRLSDDTSTPFAKMLTALIKRCCIEHPHHSVSLVLALVNSAKDKEYLDPSQKKTKSRRQTSSDSDVQPTEARVRGARLILGELLQHETVGPLVDRMRTLSEAYISLANFPIPKGTRPGVFKMDEKELMKKIKNFVSVGCLTYVHPVSKTGDYSSIVGIVRFDDKYLVVGGVNQPKKLKCQCTDGVIRAQLVKGQDDLRQDAVMQQVFSIMNTLLKSNEATAKRKLLIRTYKVVPLSQRSGVIEWCQDTEPMGSYLLGGGEQKGAHRRYRPQDLNPFDARKKMENVRYESPSKKLSTYLSVCEKLRPVFRHFFTERFPAPSVWFERRLAYIHSVATNSMIGYILGIGDRHVTNILLDSTTAELIHIDFGIAFEQGKTLPTPETVPFRLTRDIEDGMGVCGIEGIFRRCCEETLGVLRKSQEPIVTALEVLLYDPLYAWTITPQKARQLQTQDSDDTASDNDSNNCEVNILAERALQRLRQKLEGIEEGGPTSVEGQVNRLIQQARDPINLSKLYNGWQAYL